MDLVVLLPVGVAVGLVGSLIGVGGGFFVVPFLVLFRGFGPAAATAASLGVVLLNALSSTTANALRKRVDYRTGLVLAAATLPGAWLGRLVIGHLSVKAFSWSFAALLFVLAAYVGLARLKEGKGRVPGTPREITDSDGHAHAYVVNAPLGFAVSLGVGFVATLFGIGGGLLHVPFMVIVFGMPLLVATATSQFIFIFTSAAGLAESIRVHQLTPPGVEVILALGSGVVVGAQLGVAAAKRIRPRLVRGMLAAVLLTMAVLMFLNH